MIVGSLSAHALADERRECCWEYSLSPADVIGEFVAQGTVGFTITVSLIVALTMLMFARSVRRSTPARG